MKRKIKITENDLHSMILSAINEAYGTPPQAYQEFEDDAFSTLYKGKKDGDSILPRVIRALKDCYWDIKDSESDGDTIDDPRFQTVTKLIRSAILNAETVLKDEKMRRGLQPDPFYDSRHSAQPNYRTSDNGKYSYRPTYDNAPWPHSRY